MDTKDLTTSDLADKLVELIRLAATDLPSDVESRLQTAVEKEAYGSPAALALLTILENVGQARIKSCPMCQDTGTPLFFVRLPSSMSQSVVKQAINCAVVVATQKNYLRPNAVNPLTGVNSGDNSGDDHFPSIFFEETASTDVVINLVLKGGGCENVGAQYALPDAALKAERNLEGVRIVVLDAVHKAQGLGCAPGVLSVVIGGDRSSAYVESKRLFLEKLGSRNQDQVLLRFEEEILEESNQLGIGPMGFGGETTLLGVKSKMLYSLPANYFVTVSYMCWAYRRRRVIISKDGVFYE